MPVRPRCPPRPLPRPHRHLPLPPHRPPHTTTHTDLQGQGRRIRYRDLETVQLGGEYL
ncbi:hypothetical protein GCM10020295_44490 [Streptomyces cinereospinus]